MSGTRSGVTVDAVDPVIVTLGIAAAEEGADLVSQTDIVIVVDVTHAAVTVDAVDPVIVTLGIAAAEEGADLMSQIDIVIVVDVTHAAEAEIKMIDDVTDHAATDPSLLTIETRKKRSSSLFLLTVTTNASLVVVLSVIMTDVMITDRRGDIPR